MRPVWEDKSGGGNRDLMSISKFGVHGIFRIDYEGSRIFIDGKKGKCSIWRN